MTQARKHRSRIVAEIRANQNARESFRNKNRVRLAALIIESMRRKSISRIELAKLMDAHPSEVTRWTSGFHNFTIDKLTDLENVLGAKFFDRYEAPAPKGKHPMEMFLTINVKRDNPVEVTREQAHGAVKAYIADMGGVAITGCHS